MAATHHSGPVVETGVNNSQEIARTSARTASLFIDSAVTSWVQGASTVVLTRLAAGNYVKRRGAAIGAETDQIWFSIPFFMAADAANVQLNEQARGPRITSVDLIYRPGVVGLTSLTPLIQTAVFSDGAALAAPVNRPVTPTIAAAGDITFHATNLQVARFTVTTPVVVTNLMQISVDVTVVLANTGTIDWHGAFVNFDTLL